MQHFDVKGMTCQHCVRAVTQAVQDQDPAATVEVDLKTGQVNVQSSLAPDVIIGVIGTEGYAAKAL
ncbi:MAG: heavy-metal-associated domain-containing protein [Janthinobacterium lividum]|jgi:copper chaperone|uniref:heavy-metal-associated domain-containing protein n=1 Tax=Pseudomonas TaxID=286 RepID=UPI001CFB6929|nr:MULTISPECIES: cation transporter [Pseudomonas]